MDQRLPSQLQTSCLALALIAAASLSAQAPTIVHVDATASGKNNGTSWTDAYVDLAQALKATAAGEIWVAAGTYTPTTQADRLASFVLRNKVAVYGGFVGGETKRGQRDPVKNVTVLSGDLKGDDQSGWRNRLDNSEHVVTGVNLDASAVLDGFTIYGGYAFGQKRYGAGALLENAGPTFARCTIKENTGSFAGGVAVLGASPLFANCRFEGNLAHYGRGGGLYAQKYSNIPCHVTLTECSFLGNRATGATSLGYGGGIYASTECRLTVKRCTFVGNATEFDCCLATTPCEGGAILNLGTGTLIQDSLFLANRAHNGGAIYTLKQATIVDCLFAGNRAFNGYKNGGYGGAVLGTTATLTMQGCTVVGNSATEDCGGVYIGSTGSLVMENSIVWGNVAKATQPLVKQNLNRGNGAKVQYSCIQALFQKIPNEDPPNPKDFPGCIDKDPKFVDADGADNRYGTIDDNPRLQPTSPCIDAGTNKGFPAGTLADLDNHFRFVDDLSTKDTGLGTPPIADMGAFEYGSWPVESLTADVQEVSLSTGGAQTLHIDAAAVHKGQGYWVFGSVSGTTPGVQLWPVHIPLNYDAYTAITYAAPNSQWLQSSRGTLDARGQATTKLVVPNNLKPSLAGITLHHAFITFSGSYVHMASNAVALRLVQ